MAKILVLWTISTIPIPAPNSLESYSLISAPSLNILNPFWVPMEKYD
jgi:hypothetical protein